MQSLCSGENAMALLDHMETQYYELQLQLYDIQAEILQCEELLLTAQLDSIRRQMAGMIIRSPYESIFNYQVMTGSQIFFFTWVDLWNLFCHFFLDPHTLSQWQEWDTHFKSSNTEIFSLHYLLS